MPVPRKMKTKWLLMVRMKQVMSKEILLVAVQKDDGPTAMEQEQNRERLSSDGFCQSASFSIPYITRSSVLPTPVGPQKSIAAIGLFGSFKPTLDLLTALAMAVTASC
nr:hypothetical protein Iba_chr03bCG4420 [Ipomoea batatas]